MKRFFVIAICAATVVTGHSEAQQQRWFTLKDASVPAAKKAKPPARPASCEVRVLWQIPGGVGSANMEPIGKFQTDGSEGLTTYSFKDEDTGLMINTAVDYVFDYSTAEPKPYSIGLAIALSSQASDDVRRSVDTSEASTRYSKGWNLGVTKNTSLDNRIYMYTLRCWDGPINPMLRKP